MGRKKITLRYAGKCRECGAKLEVGESAWWYGKGKVYGTNCHSKDSKKEVTEFYFPSTGEYAYQNKNGRCEDAPCCGCCTC